MRRTTAIGIATLVLLAVGAGVARNAYALNACTAADIISQDSANCPNTTGACNISKNFVIADGCTLDFGTRAVTVLGGSTIDIQSNTVNIRAGSFTIAPRGNVQGRGNLAAPRDRGGFLTITTTGAVNVQRSGSFKGSFDFSANARCGTLNVVAGGPITVSGDIVVNNLTTSGGNGSISLRSTGDITTSSLSTIQAMGGDFSSGGFIDILAGGLVDLGAIINVTGGDGGVIDIESGTSTIVRGITGTGAGDAGSGGCASVVARTTLQMLGPVALNGTGSPTNSGGGCGGFIDMESDFGDTTVSDSILAESGAPDGGGGGISVTARGNINQGSLATLSVQGQGSASCGGEIDLEADHDILASGPMNASGGFGGNLVDIIAGRNATVNGRIDAQGRDAGGFGGAVTIVAGDRGQGTAIVNNVIDSGGGGCGTLNGCGLGGFNEVDGCNVTITSAGQLLSDAPDGGDNLLQAREQLTMQGVMDASSNGGMPVGTPGTNTLQFPSRLPANVTGPITPAPTSQALATCTTPGQTACLIPCPACGNGMVEFPETCDGGNTVNCDGCADNCQAQNCNDSNACTTDSCDATLGCRNDAITNGTSCSDGNVCNGVEACTNGLCRSSTPPLNCNDNNPCTSDSCSPTLGCQNPPATSGTACTDNNACTVNDTCNGAGSCTPGAPRVCTDANPCTSDSCNPATGCVFPNAPNGTGCDDNQFCTVNDSCQSGSCTGGQPRDCSDGNACTTDTCDEVNNVCVNTISGACCGDGNINGGEQCDDGNTSNNDACLNTCVNATCGDGFVRTGVEQCDAGASNSNAPNATCRLDCTPRRCGDGIVDTLTEQCDDGNTNSGDGCSATCGAEPPATAQKIPGRGMASTDCGLEWAYDKPALDRRGVPSIKQTCKDGDPACDHGSTAGECTFFIWVCSNNTDTRLPTCTPGAAGIGNISHVDAVKPSVREAGLHAEDNGNRQQLIAASNAAPTSTQNFCGPRLTIHVPLKGPTAKGVKVLKISGTTDTTLRDSDVLKLFCTP